MRALLGALLLSVGLVAPAHAEPPPQYTAACAVRVDLDTTLAWLNWTPRWDTETKVKHIVPRLHRRTLEGPVIFTPKGPEARSLRCAASDPVTGTPSLKNRDRCGAALVDAQVAEINRMLAEGLGLGAAPACPTAPPRTDFAPCPTVEETGLKAWLQEQDPAPGVTRGETYPRTFACVLPKP